MHSETVLRKTPRGQLALRDRDARLSRLARRLLILVDGRQRLAQLAADLALDADDDDFAAAVRELQDGQYVWQLDERDREPDAPGGGWHALR